MTAKLGIFSANVKTIAGVLDDAAKWAMAKIEHNCKRAVLGIEKHFHATVIACLVLSFFFRFFLIIPNPVTSDRLIYVAKAIEIMNGDFRPLVTHEIGWPMAIAAFSLLTGKSGTSSVGFVSDVASVIFSALTVLPVALAARSIFNTRVASVAAVFSAFWSSMDTAPGLSEGLFMFLLALSFYFIVRSRDSWKWMFLANAAIGYAATMKINGIVLPLVLFVGFAFSRRQRLTMKDLAHFLVSTIPFVVIVVPNWLARNEAFGSMFFYGANSNLFIDGGTSAMWAPNMTYMPSIIDYLKTHDIIAIADRFVVGGIARVALRFFTSAIPAVLIVAFAAGALRNIMSRKRYVVLFIAAILLPNALVYDAFSPTRYLVIVIPVAMILSASGLVSLLKRVKFQNKHTLACTVGCVIVCMLLYSGVRGTNVVTSPYARNVAITVEARSTWIEWGIANLQNTTLMTEEGYADMIVSSFGDPEPMHSASGIYFRSSSANISLMFAVYFDQIDDAYSWITAHGVTHYIDMQSNRDIPWAGQISADPRFVAVHSFTGVYESITIYAVA